MGLKSGSKSGYLLCLVSRLISRQNRRDRLVSHLVSSRDFRLVTGPSWRLTYSLSRGELLGVSPVKQKLTSFEIQHPTPPLFPYTVVPPPQKKTPFKESEMANKQVDKAFLF